LENGKYEMILNCGKAIFTYSSMLITGRKEGRIILKIKLAQNPEVPCCFKQIKNFIHTF
jgi:hypothetical protein